MARILKKISAIKYKLVSLVSSLLEAVTCELCWLHQLFLYCFVFLVHAACYHSFSFLLCLYIDILAVC